MSDFDTCPRSTLGHQWEQVQSPCPHCGVKCTAKCTKCGYVDRGCR